MPDDINPMIEEELVLPLWHGRLDLPWTLTAQLLHSLLEDDQPENMMKDTEVSAGQKSHMKWTNRVSWHNNRPKTLTVSRACGHLECGVPKARVRAGVGERSPQIDTMTAREALADAASIILSMDLPGVDLIRTYLTRALPAYRQGDAQNPRA